mmetsp:Transcript_20957/g.48522  ORF Transcript_20957/g.48522 Transcript_20957/m.48522 type:complete len:214 (-) Transcript_20957:549-1190(-)
MLLDKLSENLGRQPRHKGEGVEVVVDEERRVRPQVLFLKPIQHLQPHRPPLLKLVWVRPQPPHLLQNRPEHPRPALRRNVLHTRRLHPLIPQHTVHNLLDREAQHSLHVVLPQSQLSKDRGGARVGRLARRIRHPRQLVEGERLEAAPLRRWADDDREDRVHRRTRVVTQHHRENHLQQHVVDAIEPVHPDLAEFPQAPLVVFRPAEQRNERH